MTLPNFLLIGAAISGTSSFYRYLGQHPQIYVSPIKEPCFFAFDEGEKPMFFGPEDQGFFDRNVTTNLTEYQALFKNVTTEAAVGEGSVLYLYSPTAPERIKKSIPDVRLIAILRNPIDRAYSNYLHLRRDDREPLTSFKEALLAEKARFDARWEHIWQYTGLGFYYKQLRKYYELFPPENISVQIYDDLCADNTSVLRNVFNFLGVDNSFVSDKSKRYNKGGIPKVQPIHNFLNKPNSTKSILKQFLPSLLRQRIKSLVMRWNLAPSTNQELSDEIRSYLKNLYRDDILSLQTLIDRDLSCWLID